MRRSPPLRMRVVIIDSPEFTHPIAKRIRKRAPHIPIIDYVSPSVWAWRPGRAKRMRHYVDHVLALLPFEPDAHARLGGPSCTYVGHPLIEKLDEIQNADAAALARRLGLAPEVPVVLVLPGSRTSEVERLIDVFGEAVAPGSCFGAADPNCHSSSAPRARSDRRQNGGLDASAAYRRWRR